MNSSSSFEISSETLEKSFNAYDSENTDNYVGLCTNVTACELSEIKNPVKKKINEIAYFQVENKISTNSVHKLFPIINDVPGSVILIPKRKQFLKDNIEAIFKPKYFAKCSICDEMNECGSLCTKFKRVVEKKRNNFLIYLPVESQIKKSIIEHFDDIMNHLNRSQNDGIIADSDDGEIQEAVTTKYPS